MGKRSTITVADEILRIEGFDVRFIPNRPEAGPYVDPYPYTRAANSAWTVKKWRTSRWHNNYPDFDVDILDGVGMPVHGKTLLSTVRATYGADLETASEVKASQRAVTLPTPTAAAVNGNVGSTGVVK